MSRFIIKNIFKEYKTWDIVLSFVTALLFFALISAVILIPIIQIMYLYVPYLEYFLVLIYILMSLNSVYFNKIFVETLKNYHTSDTINYEVLKVRSSTIMTAIIFIIVLIVFIVLT